MACFLFNSSCGKKNIPTPYSRSRVKSSRRVRPRSWLPTRWSARSIWDSTSNCGAVRRSTNSARDSPRTQPKRSRPRRSRPRRNRPCPPSAGQCPADRPRGIRLRLTTVRPRATPESGTVFRLRQTPLPAKPGTPKRSPERIADSQPIPGAYPEKKRTDNHFRTPVCIVQFARIIPASGNGKRNNDFLTRAATDVNSDLPHRKIQ